MVISSSGTQTQTGRFNEGLPHFCSPLLGGEQGKKKLINQLSPAAYLHPGYGAASVSMAASPGSLQVFNFSSRRQIRRRRTFVSCTHGGQEKPAISVPIIDTTMMVVASLADGELLRSKFTCGGCYCCEGGGWLTTEIEVWLLRRRMKDPLLLMANMIIVVTKINLIPTESSVLLVEGACSTGPYLAKTCLRCPKLDLHNLITPGDMIVYYVGCYLGMTTGEKKPITHGYSHVNGRIGGGGATIERGCRVVALNPNSGIIFWTVWRE
uniref:Uncharacterized protein n=1 Tax=Tanacetum cinerariifolium TaxID=118510 RepID=A0A6L2LWT2_TANCI|nr:hypothetical protein [Tanacetum cinerariifolium]